MPAKRKIVIKKKPKVEEPKVEIKEEDEVMEEVVEEVKKIQEREVLGTIWWTEITKPKWRIVFEAQMWAYPMYMVPEEIRKYLQKKGLTTEVYKKSKEWLEKHHVDLEMVEKLKEFLTRRD